MEILCKLGFHKWTYYKQDIRYAAPAHFHLNGKYLIRRANVRICEKCLKKQQEMSKYFHPYWVKLNYYAKEEKREINLRKILKRRLFV